MGLFNSSKRPPADEDRPRPARAAAPVDAVEKVRTRTRQRLIGAVVLLSIGVIGFPLLFESQPRPIPVDIPIDIPKPDSLPALALPVQRPAAAMVPVDGSAASAAGAASAVAGAASGLVSTDAAPEATPALLPASSAALAAPPAAVTPPPMPSEPAAMPVPVATMAASAVESTVRYVVQVGAFADPASARQVRVKLEKLGMKTYAQIAETASGKRTRVRLGPFATRAEADKVQARSKEAGIAAVVLTL